MNDFAMALKMRGFLIVEEDGLYRLGLGSHPDDLSDLKQMLEKLNINMIYYNHKFTCPEKLENEKLHKIIWYPARNHEAGGNGGWRGYKYFSKRAYGPKIRTSTLETGVALFVKSLSAAGLTTISSCDGHGKGTPNIHFYGRYNASWFMVLFNNLLRTCKLNYDWEFENVNFIDPCLFAKSKKGKWDLQLVLDDTYQMACFLLQNGERISKFKRELFGTNRNSIRKKVKEMNFDELVAWMEQRYLEKPFLKEGYDGSTII